MDGRAEQINDGRSRCNIKQKIMNEQTAGQKATIVDRWASREVRQKHRVRLAEGRGSEKEEGASGWKFKQKVKQLIRSLRLLRSNIRNLDNVVWTTLT